jgi:hypothetical protein
MWLKSRNCQTKARVVAFARVMMTEKTMGRFEGEFDRLQLPNSSWSIMGITLIVMLIAVVVALG